MVHHALLLFSGTQLAHGCQCVQTGKPNIISRRSLFDLVEPKTATACCETNGPVPGPAQQEIASKQKVDVRATRKITSRYHQICPSCCAVCVCVFVPCCSCRVWSSWPPARWPPRSGCHRIGPPCCLCVCVCVCVCSTLLLSQPPRSLPTVSSCC